MKGKGERRGILGAYLVERCGGELKTVEKQKKERERCVKVKEGIFILSAIKYLS
jgi:hypothetical protein